ncbi:MAG: START domain-containing protein [Thermodesulfobacteriota bacterium]|nr:START domain-containing protein [Thermodesulfobacteriota bacterium]
MKERVVLLTLLVLSVLNVVPVGADDEWRVIKDEAGIRVQKRENPDLELKEYRVDSIFNETIGTIKAVLDDIPSAHKWFPLCPYARIIHEDGDGYRKILSLSDFPWPCKDRYVVFLSSTTRDEDAGRIVIDYQSVNETDDIGEIAEKYVRIEFVQGQWILEKIDDTHTRFTYTICADVGGSLPAWVVDVFLQDRPYEMVKNLKRFVKQPRYQQ